MTDNKNRKHISGEEDRTWLEEAAERITNRGARRNSRKVALRVLERMEELDINQTELADRLGVSRQQVSKIVKGQENFTFGTIDKLEKALEITLMSIDEEKRETSFTKTVWTQACAVQAARLHCHYYERFVSVERFPVNVIMRAPLMTDFNGWTLRHRFDPTRFYPGASDMKISVETGSASIARERDQQDCWS